MATTQPLTVSFWALPGGDPVPLPDTGEWKMSRQRGSPGMISVDYPADGRNFDVLHQHVGDDTDLLIEVRFGGSGVAARRAYLMESGGDDVAEAAVWRFSGHFLEQRLAEAIVEPGSGEDQEQQFGDATAGTVMATLMQQAQARGALTDVGFGSFDGTEDSNGVAWTLTVSIKLSPGMTLLEVLDALVDYGMCEWEVTAAQELRLYEGSTVGVDHTTTNPPLVLREGTNLTDAPRKHSVREAVTALLAAGKDGLYHWEADATAEGRRGRRIERSVSQGNLNDVGSLTAYTQTKLSQLVDGTLEVTRGLTLVAGEPRPLVDYDVYDWLYNDTGGGLERLRVAQITLAGDQDGIVDGSVVLNDMIAEREAALARRIRGIEGGTTITGTSTVQPVPSQLIDDLAPAAPTGVVADSLAYADEETVWASVTASWDAVVTNADATAIGDLSHYVVRYRYLDGGDLPTGNITAGDADAGTETLTWSGVVADTNIAVAVAAVDKSGNRSTWSGEFQFLTAQDATAPPEPSAPTVTPYLGQLLIRWDGLGSVGEDMPADFRLVEVHVSTSSGFTPDASTLHDRLRGGRATMWTVDSQADYDIERFVRLVALDHAGNASAPSVQGSAVPVPADDGDIAELAVGKLITGILTAVVTVSGIIRTGDTGSRVELDADGLRALDGDDEVVFEYDIPSALLTLVGQLIAGDGVGSGPTIVVSPDDTGGLPRVLYYPDATSRHYRHFCYEASVPDGPSQVAFGWEHIDTGGVIDGPTLTAWDDGINLAFRESGDTARVGGQIRLHPVDGNGAYLAYLDGDTEAYVRVASDGTHHFRGRWNNFVSAVTEQSLWCANVAFSDAGAGSVGYGATTDLLYPMVTLGHGGTPVAWHNNVANATGCGADWEGTLSPTVRVLAWRSDP